MIIVIERIDSPGRHAGMTPYEAKENLNQNDIDSGIMLCEAGGWNDRFDLPPFYD